MSTRDAIRKATIGQKKNFKSEVVEFNGVEVEIRQPSHKRRRELLKKARDKDGNVDPLDFLVWATIENVFVPDSDETVFEPADYDQLIEQPTGGFLDKLGEKAIEIFNPTDGEDSNNG